MKNKITNKLAKKAPVFITNQKTISIGQAPIVGRLLLIIMALIALKS